MNGTIGEIRGFAANFAPRTWAFCNGQLLAIASNTALFSILGTTFGGDGRSTFGLPDLRGRVPLNAGGNSSTGPGLSTVALGQKGGMETQTMTTSQMPAHNHVAVLHARKEQGDKINPKTKVLASDAGTPLYSSGAVDVTMSSTSIEVENVGAGLPIHILNPYLAINMIICLQGIYPSRN